MSVHNTERIFHAHSIALIIVGISLLSFGAPALADDDGDENQPLYYPLPPSPPRLQYLATYSSAADVGVENKKFRDFVFGGKENLTQLISKPYGVALYAGAIYVVDTRGNGYGVFDLANKKSRIVRPSGAGALLKPINITIDKDGTKFVTDTDREQVLVYNASDRFVRAIGESGQFKPVDVAIVGDRLYVTDIAHHQVHVLDKATGEALFSFGGAGSDPGDLYHPTNLAIGPDETIYVSDTTNFRIQQFALDGEFIREVGSIGTGHGSFARPKGVAIDRDGLLYVVDAAFENVQILAPDGSPLMAFGGPGMDRGNINMPTVVKIDYENVSYFEKYAAPNFDIKYLVVVASQFGLNKVVVFGFGELRE